MGNIFFILGGIFLSRWFQASRPIQGRGNNPHIFSPALSLPDPCHPQLGEWFLAPEIPEMEEIGSEDQEQEIADNEIWPPSRHKIRVCFIFSPITISSKRSNAFGWTLMCPFHPYQLASRPHLSEDLRFSLK